jgi:hypothetical protein
MTNRQQLAPSKMSSPIHQPNPTSPIKRLLNNTLGKINWKIWAVLLVLVSGGIGFSATSWLLKLPKAPNCPKIFWPIASASMRLYCAQLEAEKGTVEGLLSAINLVEALSKNHPLRTEIDGNVEEWAVEILDLAEREFNEGKLEDAIATARKIPNDVEAYNLVAERIATWQATWSEGEEIFAEVEKHLRQSKWNMAFREAVKLLNLDNQYWATTRYEEITKEIQLAQEESSKLDGAYIALRRGGIDNWIKAVEDAQTVNPDSYAHQEALNLIAKAKDKIVEYIENRIENRDWQAVLDATDRMPEILGLEEEMNDWQTIASAGADSQVGTVESLESAILTAQQLAPSRPLYNLAQELIGRWKLEIQDVARLEQARNLAQSGSIDDLNAAISQADLVPQDNPRYREARQEIDRWVSQIQTIEDQPILARADELAISGSVPALQEAIAQASAIGSNRSLYGEARQRINQWRSSIEEQEDRPFLDQAISLASGRNYEAAIDAARQIGRGRALYPEARRNIGQWQQEIQSQRNFQEAATIAEAQTPEALSTAINILKNIPASTDVGSESQQALNRWSYQLLNLAENIANTSSVQEAIDLARTIPRESTAYESARSQIRMWRKMLEPQPLPPAQQPLMQTNWRELGEAR